MRMGSRKLILLPLLASIMVLSLGAAIQAKESGWLGVVLQPLTEEIKEAMELDAGIEGVLISDVVDDSPAEECGIEDGDIIIMIDDVKTPTVEEAIAAVKDRSPGEKVVVAVIRDGKKAKMEVELGERDIKMEKMIERYEFMMPGMGHLPEMGKQFAHSFMKPRGFLGVRVTEISEDLGDYFGVKSREGVLVIEVIDDSPAEYASLKEGDVILEVDGKELKGPDRLVKYMKKCEPGEEVEVTYKRKRRTRTVTVELEGAPGQGMPWFQQGHGICGCGHKDCKGGCGHKGGCDHKGMSQYIKKCMEKCKQMNIMSGDGKCHMEIIDDEGGKKRIIIKTEDGVKTINIPDMDIDLDFDDLEDLEELKDIHMYHLQDAGGLKEEIDDLQEEIEELKKELKKLGKS